jgi:hypothetical protein
MRITIELEAPGDARTMFRMLVGEKLVAEGLTAAQAHVLVGDILEKLALPNGRSESESKTTSLADVAGRA